MIHRKFLKEFTGYASDLINQYNIISEKQCEALNKIIWGENNKEIEKLHSTQIEVSVNDKSKVDCMECSCKKNKVNVSEISQIGGTINDIIASMNRIKIIVKLEISSKKWKSTTNMKLKKAKRTKIGIFGVFVIFWMNEVC